MNYRDKLTKHDLIQNLPSLLENNSPDHTIFFSTFTFENNRLADEITDYRRFFYNVWSVINQKTVSVKGNKSQFSKLILIPEKSAFKDKNIHFTHRHYHGFIFIPKTQEEKFNRNCVTACHFDEVARKDRIILNPKIVAPFSKKDRTLEALRKIHLDNRQLAPMNSSELQKMNRAQFLNVQSYAIYKMNGQSEEFTATSFYSGKKFRASAFASDDVLLYVRS